MKNHKIVNNIFNIVLVALLLFLILNNTFGFYDDSFYEANLVQIITLAIAYFFTYYFTQIKLDVREKKRVLNEYISELDKKINEININMITSQNSKDFMDHMRSIENILYLIEKIKDEYNITENIDYIKNELNEIKSIVSDHIGNNEELTFSLQTIKRHINLTSAKLKEVLFYLVFEKK